MNDHDDCDLSPGSARWLLLCVLLSLPLWYLIIRAFIRLFA